MSTPILTANVRHDLLDDSAVRFMRNKIKLSFDCGDSGSKT
jgi:hypothetical protein